MGTTNGMPDPRRETLKRPPLELVVAQVRHEPQGAIGDASRVLELQEAIGDGFSKLEPANANEIALNERNVSVQAKPGWRLTTTDGHWVITLSADSFTLEAARYTTWTEFKRRFFSLVRVVEAELQPKLMQRLGLRYIDRIIRDDSGKPAEWVGFIEAPFLGLASDSDIGGAVSMFQSVHELRVGDNVAVVRGSCATDNTPSGYSMLIDTDCSTDRAQAFISSSIEDSLEDLHTLSLQIFQTALTKKLYAELQS